MSVLSVTAAIECDECGAHFRVDVDTARRTDGWSVHDYAEDAVRGGHVVAKAGEKITLGSCSIQREQMLCIACTDRADEEEE